MQWAHMVLALACLGCGVFHLARLVLVRVDKVGEGSHAAMSFGMAAMFSPLGDPIPAGVWIAVFALTGVWFAGLAMRSGFGTRDAGYHVVFGVTMLFMLIAGADEHEAMGSGGHAGHGAGSGLGFIPVAAVVLAGFFVWHALRCGDRIVAAGRGETVDGCGCPTDAPAPSATSGSVVAVAPAAAPTVVADLARPAAPDRLRLLRAPRTAAAVHLGMAGAMTLMLLGML